MEENRDLAQGLHSCPLGMAKTNKLIRQLKQSRGMEILPPKDGRTKSAALYLLELRSRHHQAQLPRRKFVITIDHPEGNSALPHSIKITHT